MENTLLNKKQVGKAFYFTSKKERFKMNVGKKNVSKEGKKNLLSTIEKTVKALDFDTITIMVMEAMEVQRSKNIQLIVYQNLN